VTLPHAPDARTFWPSVSIKSRDLYTRASRSILIFDDGFAKEWEMPSADELLGYHLVYEIWMLRKTFERFPTDDPIINNAVIGLFSVGARDSA
jgi:hypothetical protein